MTLAVRLCDVDNLRWRNMLEARGGDLLSTNSSPDEMVSVGDSSSKIAEIFDVFPSLSK